MKSPLPSTPRSPTADYRAFIENEVRYSSLKRAFPDRAEVLFDKAAEYAKDKYEHLTKLGALYNKD